MQTQGGKMGIPEIGLTEDNVVLRPVSMLEYLEFRYSEAYVEV